MLCMFKNWRRKILFFLFTYFLSLVVSFFIDYISFNQEISNFLFFPYFSFNLVVFFFLSLVNLFTVYYFNKNYSRKEYMKRLILEGLLAIISANIITHIIGISFGLVDFLIPFEIILINSVQNIIIICLLELIYSYIKSNEDSIKIQKLNVENEKFRYKQLKNQINPHFLFNSLNLISAMTYNPKKDKSTIYIDKLAEIYRYVLQNDEKDIIKLSMEIDFINNYIEILKVRIYEGLYVNINLDNNSLIRNILPMSLQLLIENVLKHNIADSNTPLFVNIYSEAEYIIITNNINHNDKNHTSMGTGLINLNQRYKLITGKEIIVINDNNNFTVKIPLI